MNSPQQSSPQMQSPQSQSPFDSSVGVTGDPSQDSQKPGTQATNYSGSDKTCATCQYFDGASQCSNPDVLSDPEVPNGQVDPAGRCDLFQAGSQQSQSPISSPVQGPNAGFSGVASKPPSKKIKPMENPSGF